MKKVLIVNTGTGMGGIEKCLINFLKYLEKKDCDVDLALWREGPLFDQIPNYVNYIGCLGPGSLKDIIRIKRIKRIIPNLISYIRYKCVNKKNKGWKGTKKLNKEYDIAISYSQGGHSPYFIIDNVNAKKKFMWYHELNYCSVHSKKFDADYFSKFDKIFCVSKACCNNLSNEFNSFREKFVTIHNLYNIEEIVEKSEQERNPFAEYDKTILLTVGRLSEEKGINLALQTCFELLKKTKNFVWYWVGDGPMKDYAQQWIDEHNMSDFFQLLGNKINPYVYMKNCSIYIQPSLSEAYCTAVVENLVLKKPMIVTDVPTFFEQIHEGEDALVTAKNPIDFSNKILEGMQYTFKFHEINEMLNNTEEYDRLIFGENILDG